MQVVITDDDGGIKMVRIPTWHYELFRDDPYSYLDPFLRGMGPDIEWNIIE